MNKWLPAAAAGVRSKLFACSKRVGGMWSQFEIVILIFCLIIFLLTHLIPSGGFGLGQLATWIWLGNFRNLCIRPIVGRFVVKHLWDFLKDFRRPKFVSHYATKLGHQCSTSSVVRTVRGRNFKGNECSVQWTSWLRSYFAKVIFVARSHFRCA